MGKVVIPFSANPKIRQIVQGGVTPGNACHRKMIMAEGEPKPTCQRLEYATYSAVSYTHLTLPTIYSV